MTTPSMNGGWSWREGLNYTEPHPAFRKMAVMTRSHGLHGSANNAAVRSSSPEAWGGPRTWDVPSVWWGPGDAPLTRPAIKLQTVVGSAPAATRPSHIRCRSDLTGRNRVGRVPAYGHQLGLTNCLREMTTNEQIALVDRMGLQLNDIACDVWWNEAALW